MLIYNTWKGVVRKESLRQVHKHINSGRRGAEPPFRGQVGQYKYARSWTSDKIDASWATCPLLGTIAALFLGGLPRYTINPNDKRNPELITYRVNTRQRELRRFLFSIRDLSLLFKGWKTRLYNISAKTLLYLVLFQFFKASNWFIDVN